MAENVKPFPRGELEITTLNDMYLKEGRLNAQLLGVDIPGWMRGRLTACDVQRISCA